MSNPHDVIHYSADVPKPVTAQDVERLKAELAALEKQHAPLDAKAREQIATLEAQKTEADEDGVSLLSQLEMIRAQHRALDSAWAVIVADYQERHDASHSAEIAAIARTQVEDDEFEKDLRFAHANPSDPRAHRTFDRLERRQAHRYSHGPAHAKPAHDPMHAWFKDDLPGWTLSSLAYGREQFYAEPIRAIDEKVRTVQVGIRKRAEKREQLADQLAEAEKKRKAADAEIVASLKRQGLKLVSDESESAA